MKTFLFLLTVVSLAGCGPLDPSEYRCEGKGGEQICSDDDDSSCTCEGGHKADEEEDS